MKRIFSTKDKEHSAREAPVPKAKAPPGALQFFTYDDVNESSAPRIGDFPQHGDTVALGAAEATEAEVARNRASKRHSAQIEAEHEDIFANAPEEPLAPEGPSKRSRDGSRRSSRRMSRRGSIEAVGGAGPSSSRNSRPISPERPLRVTNGVTSPMRDSKTGSRRLSRRASDVDDTPVFHASRQTPEPFAPEAAAPRPIAPRPIAQPAHEAIAASELPTRKTGTPTTETASPVPDGTLSQVPTASDALSRLRTNTTNVTAPSPVQAIGRPQSGAQSGAPSGAPSRQSTSRPLSTTGTTKSKSSRRQSKRASKPQPLKYFTYDDVAEGAPPVFGNEQEAIDAPSRNSRSIKGKQRESNVPERDVPKTPTDPPQVPELPQRLSQMDMSGTGLSRRATGREQQNPANNRNSNNTRAPPPGSIAPAAAQTHLQTAPAPQAVPAPTSSAASRLASREKRNAAVYGLDFSDIPGNGAQGGPPPVNMSTKPPSKRPSREFRSAGPMAATGRESQAAKAHDAARPVRTSSFHEHLGDDDVAVASSAAPVPPAGQKRRLNQQQHGATLAQETQRETFLPSPVATPAPAAVLAPAPAPAPIPLPQELDASQQPVVQRTKDALVADSHTPRPSQTPQGARTPKARRVAPPPPQAQQPLQTQAPPQTALGQMGADSSNKEDGAFVSAPSTPAAEKSLAMPSTAEVVEKSKYNSADTTVSETIAPAVVHETVHKHIKHVREERITREVHYYDIYHRVQPIIDVEVLSARHFINTHDRGLVEISEKDIPGGASNRPNWTIAARQPSAADRAALLEGRYADAPTGEAGTRQETREWMHPDGYPVKETTHIHPPVLNEGGVKTGQTVPFHFDHSTGHADFVPPGVPGPSRTRTRGNSITNSVDDAAEDLSKVDLRDAKSVNMTAHSGATQTLKPGVATGSQPSTEYLSSQNI